MSGAAAAAAAARIRREEEEMTPYTHDDLSEDWEFKILRSNTGAFKKPAVLNQVLAEEAQAGWVLVEKFDNNRIRLKRPASASKSHMDAGIDPYRTYVGLSEGQFVFVVVACTLGSILALAAVIGAVAAML